MGPGRQPSSSPAVSFTPTDTGAAAVVLRIDTPGGLHAFSTRDINRAILASEVPVIAWVDTIGAPA